MTLPPLTVTLNPKPFVEEFKSGVDVSVQDAPLPSQVAITVPSRLAPPDSVTQ